MLETRSPRPGLVPPALLDRVVRHFDPDLVILFGSRARGDAHPDSDWDLLVVVPDDTPPERRTLAAACAAVAGWGGAADVIPCRRSAFERRRRVIGALPQIAAGEGVVVHARG